MKKFTNNFSKKGQAGTDSALIQLFYIILGVFVLLTFVKIIITFLNLDSNSNNDISKSNAESIYNFQSYSSSNKYSSLDSCYTTLKLTNLENYQFKSSEETSDNKMIVINKQGISTYPLSKKDDFYDNPSSSNLNSIKKFESEIKLVKDITAQGSIATIDLEIFAIGSFDSLLVLGSEVEYITFEPIFGKEFGSTFDNIFDENFEILNNQNNYLVKLITKDVGGFDIVKIQTAYLAYNPKTKEMFVTAGKVSDSIIINNLCSYKNFRNKIEHTDFVKNDGKDIPVGMYDVFFRIEKGNTDLGYKFTWSDKIICGKNQIKFDCYDKLNIDKTEQLTYNEFIDSIKNYIISLEKDSASQENLNLKITYDELTKNQTILRQETMVPQLLKFDQVFSVKDNGWDFTGDNYGDIEEPIYNINNDINGCKSDEYGCKHFYFISSLQYPVFFVDREDDKFIYASFNVNYLRYDKSTNSFYFNGKKLTDVKEYDVDDLGLSFIGTDIDIILLNGLEMIDRDGNKKTYSAVISETQKQFVKEVKKN